jgi:hypothetical protein
MNIPVPRFMAHFLLWLSQFFHERYFLLLCMGYGDDHEMYTALYWDDDRDFCFGNPQYYDFRLWLFYRTRG